MFNAIKMDLYRIFRTKSLYVIWIILAVVLIYTTKLLAVEMEAGHQVAQEMSEEVTQMNLGMSVTLSNEPDEEVTVYDVMYANTSAKFFGLFLVIFAVIFSAADINSGYVKNTAGQVKNRGYLIIAKAVVLILFTVLTLLGSVMLLVITNQFVFGTMELGNIKDFVLYVGTQIVLHVALVLIVMAIAIILKNNMASMVIAICLTMNVMTVFYSGIDKLVAKFEVEEFHLIEHTVTGKIALLPMKMAGKDCIEGIVIALVFGMVSMLLAGYVFKKRDI